MKSIPFLLRDFGWPVLLVLFLGLMPARSLTGQAVPERFADNDTAIEWLEISTDHFKIVFPGAQQAKAPELASQAEQIYNEFAELLGTEPSEKITIYYKSDDELVSGPGAIDTGDEYSIWTGDPLALQFVPGEKTYLKTLRQQIAYAFRHQVHDFPVDYYHYLFSRAEQSPWSDGFTSFMALPEYTGYDRMAEAGFGTASSREVFRRKALADSIDIMKGRSQIRYFLNRFGDDAFAEIYGNRQSFLGIASYFDFNTAFKEAAGLNYDAFFREWARDLYNTEADRNRSGYELVPPDSSREVTDPSPDDFSVRAYNAFSNIRWEPPFAIPYYLGTDDFGLGAYINLIEPMRTHEFSYYGSISFTDPIGKSFFYSKYTNNRFRPQIELSFNRFPSASGFFGKSRKVETSTIAALESLWKLTGLSRGNSQWYFGLTLRHMAFEYFREATFRRHHPNLYYNNTKTRQTDVKAALTWRNFKSGRHTLIHPLDGEGVRLSATVSEKILGSQTQHTRLNMDAYTILPAPGDHRIYVYGNGVMDLGEPAGRDFLSFSDDGDYRLPGPDFTGSINPGFDRFVRGYTTNLTGDRFVYGTLEYRIPFLFDTRRKVLGFIPPARTSFTLFADVGAMGEARLAGDRTATVYRYSAGAELKRVFSAGGSFKITYELGVAQPLNKSLGPVPYFNIKSALPF